MASISRWYFCQSLWRSFQLSSADLLRPPLGQALRAIQRNGGATNLASPAHRRVIGYVISAVTGAAGGVLLAALQGLASPSFSYWIQSGEFVFIAVLGGGAHPIGAFLGALIFEGVRIYASAFANDVWELILGVVIIGIILFAPRGIAGLAVETWTKGIRPKSVDENISKNPILEEPRR